MASCGACILKRAKDTPTHTLKDPAGTPSRVNTTSRIRPKEGFIAKQKNECTNKKLRFHQEIERCSLMVRLIQEEEVGVGVGGVLPGDMTEQCGSEAQGGFNEVSLSALRL